MTSAFIKSFKGFGLGESEFPGRWIAKLNSTPSASTSLFNLVVLRPLCASRSISPLSSLVFTSTPSCVFRLQLALFLPSFARKLDSCFQFRAEPPRGSGPAFLCFFRFVFKPVESFVYQVSYTTSCLSSFLLLTESLSCVLTPVEVGQLPVQSSC